MPRPKNTVLEHHFKDLPPSGPFRAPRTRCLRCQKEISATATRKATHLDSCEAFKIYLHNRNGQTGVQSPISAFMPVKMDDNRKKKLDHKLAKAIFGTGRPFTLFEDELW